MVDVTITATAVVAAANAPRTKGNAGETIGAGQMVYRAAATNKWMLGDANGSAEAKAMAGGGMALNGAADGQPLEIALPGADITMNAGLTAGTTYYLSSTPGGVCPVADVGSGEDFVVVGIARSTTVLRLGILASGVSA
jgi:hypothetical protein